MCRWLERDPAGYQDGPSLYSYLGRNPMAGTDPYGLSFGGSGGAEEPGRRRVRTLLPKPGSGLRRSMVGADHPAAILQRAEDDWRRRCGPQFGSDAEFARDMRINSDRLEKVGEVAGVIGAGIETTASVLPGGGFATTVNEASQGNFGAAALGVIPGAAALKVLRVGSKTAKAAKAARLKQNKTTGDAFRDALADSLGKDGVEVAKEVRRDTPLGPRVIDIEVRVNGVPVGGIEAKTGGARYGARQRAKDEWLRQNGYPVHVVRDP